MSKFSLEDAIRIAADGDAILFVGAGVGFLMEGKRGPIPNGAVLSNRILGRKDSTPNPPTLDKAAGFAIRRGNGVEGVYNTLVENLTVVSIDPRLAELYALPWRRIYTTNYDDGIEMSRIGKVTTNSCTLEDGTDKSRDGSVIHLNGQMTRVSPPLLDKALSLSDRSYADRNLERSPWYSYIAQDFDTARAVIFIGYSLYDLDISRLLFASNISDKTFFFVAPDIDEVDAENLSLYGQVGPNGAVGLLDAIKSSLDDYPRTNQRKVYSALLEIRVDHAKLDLDPTRVLDAQLVYGILPEAQTIAATPAFADQQFIVQREQQLAALSGIDNGVYRDILVTGELASGKSSTALSLAAEFIRRGYRAYIANHGNNLPKELEQIARNDDRIVIVFDGYLNFRQIIRDYLKIRPTKHRLILTEQAVHHEFSGELIYEPALAGQVFELGLDKISPNDTKQFAKLINFGGYWRDRSGASDETNARYIENQLEGSLYRTLMEIVESASVQDRIDAILKPILHDRRATEVFVAACIVNVLGAQFRITDWVGAFDTQFVKSVLRNYHAELKYFLFSQAGNVFARSGLLSAAILKRILDRSILLDASSKLFGIAARLKQPHNMYEDVYVRLMQFNRIQPIMHGDNERDLIFRFYDLIRPIEGTYRNADYWLQLGIAATAFDDLGIAGDAFENAYSREKKKPKPNFKKIDNYYNRYRLKHSAALTDPNDAFDTFKKATEGLTKQMFLEDNRHYPFKSGRVYGAIARRHFDHWNDAQKKYFIHETRSIREKALEYDRRYKGQSVDVEVLIRETGELLKKLDPA